MRSSVGLVVVVIAVLAAGCPKRISRHVYVPKSAAPCWRECKAQSIECRKDYKEWFCEDQRLDCLLTCPGAYETAPIVEQR